MSRYTSYTSGCSCGSPSVFKALAAEQTARDEPGRLEKGLKRAQVTSVARYVQRKQPGLARKLRGVLRSFSRALAKRLAARWPAEKLAKADGPSLEELLELLDAESLGVELTGELEGAMLAAFRRAAKLGAAQVGLTEDNVTRQLDERALEYAKARGAELVKDLAGTTADDMRALLSRAVEDGMSAAELSDAVQEAGAFGEARANAIARTELAFAHVQGNVDGWRSSGLDVKKRSILGDLHDAADVCDECEDAGVKDMDEDFVEGYAFPPFHPNATLEGSSFASYGKLRKLIKARYSGPAIELEAEEVLDSIEELSRDAVFSPQSGSLGTSGKVDEHSVQLFGGDRHKSPFAVAPNRVKLTIGPNHPMLTRRGFVPASLLEEGDELVYDRLADPSFAGSGEPDLKEVMLLEDAFSSLKSVFGASVISSAAGHFHGDEAFTYGEVYAVRPDGDLLPVLDPGGIEKLCQDELVRADAELQSFSRLSPGRSSLWGFYLPKASPSHGLRNLLPLGRGHESVSRFQRFRIVACHVVSFEGHAFDASTDYGIYNSGGFVVKNCVCDVEPVLSEEDGE